MKTSSSAIMWRIAVLYSCAISQQPSRLSTGKLNPYFSSTESLFSSKRDHLHIDIQRPYHLAHPLVCRTRGCGKQQRQGNGAQGRRQTNHNQHVTAMCKRLQQCRALSISARGLCTFSGRRLAFVKLAVADESVTGQATAMACSAVYLAPDTS